MLKLSLSGYLKNIHATFLSGLSWGPSYVRNLKAIVRMTIAGLSGSKDWLSVFFINQNCFSEGLL